MKLTFEGLLKTQEALSEIRNDHLRSLLGVDVRLDPEAPPNAFYISVGREMWADPQKLKEGTVE